MIEGTVFHVSAHIASRAYMVWDRYIWKETKLEIFKWEKLTTTLENVHVYQALKSEKLRKKN